MKVTNINGTSDNKCVCGSWLEHWENFSTRSLPPFCPVEGCINSPEVGAHVQRDSPIDSNWYIIPLCKKHNAKKGESLIVDDLTEFVSANVSMTCGED